ncbi:MAG: hypothetical protein JWP85_1941 [Rhodoglobus sp.]|nr:hypothetical protein [Rhodoglobus sp.]
MIDATDDARYTATALAEQTSSILLAWGMPADTVAITVDAMIDTDLSGVDSHGVSMLMMYENLKREGRLDLLARPEVSADLGAFAVIDGNNGLGHPAGVAAMTLAMDKARSHGIGAVAVRNSNHFGAVGYYVRLASDAGLIGLATTSTRTPAVAALGGTTPVLGTNPIAFSAPRVHGEPLVVDMSTSVVAMNKIKAYALKGKQLPPGWLQDRDGNVVTDADEGYRLLGSRGATLTLLGGSTTESGGHKGFGLSLIVQVLSGALSNASAPGRGVDRDNLGHFFLAIDPELVNPGGLTAQNVEELLSSMVDEEPGVLIPGQPESEYRADRAANGIPLPHSLLRHIEDICGRAGVPLTLAPVGG